MNAVSELKKTGIHYDLGPLKLKQGYGEAIQWVLESLVDKVMRSTGFVASKPIYKSDE